MGRDDTRYIVIHCTATPPTTTVGSIKAGWIARGWSQVGYHELIEYDGTVNQLADCEEIVNGVKGHNYHAYHICYIGGDTGDTRSLSQKVSLMDRIFAAQTIYPNAEVVGHRDLSPDLDGDGVIEPHEWVKLCPQFNVNEFVEMIESLKDRKDEVIKKLLAK